MGWFRKILGLCDTPVPGEDACWTCSEGKIELDLAQVPELASRGTAVRLEGRGLPVRVLVVHGTNGRFYAFKNRCTHMGRRIDPMPGAAAVRCCSVSGSTFDYTGNVMSGPAKGGLTTFRTHLGKQLLTIILQ